VKRYPENPILTRTDIPDIPPLLSDVSSVFNPGAVRRFDPGAGPVKISLLLRVQARSRETAIVPAHSADGVHFQVEPRIVRFAGIEKYPGRIHHVYDPRITPIDGVYYIMVALDVDDGCRLGLAKTPDFDRFEFCGIVSEDDNRNGVLFPEKINGFWLRLDRPNRARRAGGPASGSAIWLSASNDLLRWKPVEPLIEGRFHYWDEFIGAGPPPLKTRKGWLQVYHGVAGHFQSASVYQAGVFLMDLEDPTKVLGRSRHNILEPRESYELAGQVPNVVFPSGLTASDIDEDGFAREEGKVKVYYGAADTAVGLAETTVAELLRACAEGPIP
jgi:beta-1,4-mannooligosaccharide/beta-1,4-mannosyl-N-acetylglucosamine phosphorylase